MNPSAAVDQGPFPRRDPTWVVKLGASRDEDGNVSLQYGGHTTPVLIAQPAKNRAETAPCLIVYDGALAGAIHKLSQLRTQVGRSAYSDLRFLERTVSRRHALLEINPLGQVVLTDLGSTAGTFVNGLRLPAHRSRLLTPGDQIRFGDQVVVCFNQLDPLEEEAYRERFRRAVSDPLTGLYNRLYFLEEIYHWVERHPRRSSGLALLLIDLDHFKNVNDEHGHAVGDRVLRLVAEVLERALGEEALLARFGGEEFIAAMEVSDLDAACALANRVREEVARRPYRPFGYGGSVQLSLTLSVGVAYLPPRGDPVEPDQMIRAADLCLGQAKRRGRNRVVSEREYAPARLIGLEFDTTTLMGQAITERTVPVSPPKAVPPPDQAAEPPQASESSTPRHLGSLSDSSEHWVRAFRRRMLEADQLDRPAQPSPE